MQGSVGPMEVATSLLFLYVVAVFFALPVWLAYRKGIERGHDLMGLLLGLFLGWIGVLILAFLPKQRSAAASH